MSPAKKEAISMELSFGSLILAVMIAMAIWIATGAKSTIEDRLVSIGVVAGIVMLVIILEYFLMKESMQNRKRRVMNERAHHSSAHYLLWRRNQRLENEQKRTEWETIPAQPVA